MRRFSIRDLLWLTLVVALGVMWWTDRRASQEELARIRFVLRMGGPDETADEFLEVLKNAQKPTPRSVRVRKSPPSPLP